MMRAEPQRGSQILRTPERIPAHEGPSGFGRWDLLPTRTEHSIVRPPNTPWIRSMGMATMIGDPHDPTCYGSSLQNPRLRLPPSPLRRRRPATSHPTDQPCWTSHLVENAGAAEISLTADEVEALDAALSSLPTGAVFGGSGRPN